MVLSYFGMGSFTNYVSNQREGADMYKDFFFFKKNKHSFSKKKNPEKVQNNDKSNFQQDSVKGPKDQNSARKCQEVT